MTKGKKNAQGPKGRSCDGKKRFGTHKEAQAHIDSMYKGKLAITRLVSYQCTYCAGWHVGHSRFRGRTKR